ncbi:class I SAM-dependent methyltransferase [Paenibacillus oleatilyticus]|uniref:class I SAM-dependent methyltransferase n=1 Tax=Paenibacillus oleatilyticus TaxID=2594886 RepID=UPI001C1F4DE4|nr:methyltransferase domain-containing protein [Paenibacillus oleatilyticus]MBU7316963.1 methyltransferase domain-containing protein [Paenibacillus oleatilyticus]
MSTLQEKLLFLYKFSRDPQQIGSVTPSSAFLAKKMVESVAWEKMSAVAELGAGTGAITEYIQKAKKDNTRVLLFERDTELRDRLQERFVDCACYDDARCLQSVLRTEGIDSLDCVISGLPYFNFPQSLRDQLLSEITASLRPGGRFIAFQYSQQMRKQFSKQFAIEGIYFVPFNVPPAFVYVCRKEEG